MSETGLRHLIAVAFTASGFSALAYQVAWQRVLTQVIGSDAISAVFVVTIFMLCLGIGAELARLLLTRRRLPLAHVYAIIEIAIGLYGLISIPLMRGANAWWASLGPSSLPADAALNLLLLAFPVIGMGMTTPLIVQLGKRRLEDLGRIAGTLYGLNIIGAALGALVTGLVLIEALGLQGTTVVAALINLSIAGVLFIALRQGHDDKPTELPIPSPRIGAAYTGAAVAFGFGTLAMQVILFRVAINYFTMATIVFPLVLFVYLLLMSLGQVIGGRLADRDASSLPMLLAVLFFSGAVLLLIALRFPPAWAAGMGALYFSSFSGGLVQSEFPRLVGDPSPLKVIGFGIFLMLSVVAWSALFPVMLRIVTDRVENAGRSFARLYALYTFGNVLGIAVIGLWSFVAIGTGPSTMLTIVVVSLGTMLVSGVRDRRSTALIAAGVACATLVPIDYYKQFRLGNYAVDQVYEGLTGVATTATTSRFYKIVDMNRTASASAIQRDPEFPESQYEAWRWNHTELMALDSGYRPKTALIIGIGHAYLIDALLDLPFLEKITVVDISPEVIQAVRENTLTTTKRIFSDPRVEIVVADGRRYVQKAIAQGVKFDLIQNKINEPWHAGSGNLFTVEFLRLEKELLTDGGYLGVRPLVGHLRDGLEVFGAAVYPGYYHLFFKNGVLPQFDQATITSDMRDAWRTELPGHGPTGSRSTELSVLAFNRDADLKDIDANTDDHPTFEYYKLRQWLGLWTSPRLGLDAPRFRSKSRSVPVVEHQSESAG